MKSLDFVGLKIKDAVCDAFRDIYDARPSVGKINPDIRIHAFIDERNVEIFIDTSGEATLANAAIVRIPAKRH